MSKFVKSGLMLIYVDGGLKMKLTSAFATNVSKFSLVLMAAKISGCLKPKLKACLNPQYYHLDSLFEIFQAFKVN